MQGHRFEQRKKQRMNKILNIAIGIVVILILVFGAQIFFGSSPSEEAMVDPEDQTVVNEDQEPDTVQDPIEQKKNTVETNPEDDIGQDEEDNEDITDDNEEMQPVPDGEWEPVGTNQSGEFTLDFNKSGANWAEMSKALRYATGLDDSMIIWRLENGGSPTRARGVVSAPDSQDQPYEVIIEWIDGQGWMPIDKQQLASNPYRG